MTSAVKKEIKGITVTALAALLLFSCFHFVVSCSKSGVADETPLELTTLIIHFETKVGPRILRLDTLMYLTSSGNSYMVTDLQYFISDLTLHKSNGENFRITDDNSIHYIDARIPESDDWIVDASIPFGAFDSISFTFGLNAKNNYSNRFPNPPERNMNWPDILGGGYHYMKMNLLWKNAGMDKAVPFNFHIGIGQVYKGNVINPDSITGYVQNFFNVSLPASAFTLSEGRTEKIVISMDLNRWFTGNNEFDFSKYPNMMMQDEAAMQNACLNGRGAFSVRFNSRGK